MYVQCKLCDMKVQTVLGILFNFREKILNFPKNDKVGTSFNSSGAPSFVYIYISVSFSEKKNKYFLSVECSELDWKYFLLCKLE